MRAELAPTRDPYDVPSRRDRVVATVTGFVGGPTGHHAVVGARGLAGVASATVAMAAVALALGVWQKGHCLLKGWANPDQFWRMCYSDVPVLHVTTGLADRRVPYLDPASALDLPPLSGLALWVVSAVSPEAGTHVAAQQWVFATWAVLALLLLAAAVVAAVALRPRRPWQAAHLAASPVLVVLALVSTDLLGIALTMWALWCWRTGRGGTAGVLLGLAALVRPYPLVFLAALVLVGLRAGRSREAGRTLVGAVLGPGVLLAPFLALGDGALQSLVTWWQTGPGYGSLALVPQLLGNPLSPAGATAVSLGGWALALGLGTVITFRSARVPGVVRVVAPMLLVVVLTAKAVPVQSGLWVLPLLALSTVAWRDHLVWAAVELAHFVTVWLHIGFGSDPGKGLPGDTYALFVALRMAGWAWVVWQAWSTPPPRRTPVRSPSPAGPVGADREADPAGRETPHPDEAPAGPAPEQTPATTS